MKIDWGLAVSVVGILISVIQTIRFREATRHLNRLKRVQNANIWHNISMVINAYDTIEDARNFIRGDGGPDQRELVYAKISSARRCIVDQYLDLLKEAVLDEEDFTEDTISRWQAIGRLENPWRVAQARKFLNAKSDSVAERADN